MTADEIRANVDAYLQEIGRDVVPRGLGFRDRTPWSDEKWECDAWRVEVYDHKSYRGHGVSYGRGPLFETDYYTGLGHREVPPLTRLGWDYKAEKERRGATSTYLLKQFGRVKTPPAADVLHCLVLDEVIASMSFRDYCAELGGDTDSIKSLNQYNATCELGAKLRTVFTHEQIARLRQLTEEL